MGKKRIGERTCMGCGKKDIKSALLRFVRREDGRLCLDLLQREDGRGGYLCPRESCFDVAARKKRPLAIRFRGEVREDVSSLIKTALDRIKREAENRDLHRGRRPKHQNQVVVNGSNEIRPPVSSAMQFFSEFFSGGGSGWPK